MPLGIGQLLNWGPPWQTTTGTIINTATTQTISPQATGPADFSVATAYLYTGAVIYTLAQGMLTTTATSTTHTVFLAAGSGPTTLATPSGLTTGTTAITSINWQWETWSRITNVASSGNTVSTQGHFKLYNAGAALPANPSVLTATAGLDLPAPNSGGETAAAVNTTIAMPIMLRATLAAAQGSITCTQFLVFHLYG